MLRSKQANKHVKKKRYCNDNNQIKSGTKIITTSMLLLLLHRNAHVFGTHKNQVDSLQFDIFPHESNEISKRENIFFCLSYIITQFSSFSNSFQWPKYCNWMKEPKPIPKWTIYWIDLLRPNAFCLHDNFEACWIYSFLISTMFFLFRIRFALLWFGLVRFLFVFFWHNSFLLYRSPFFWFLILFEMNPLNCNLVTTIDILHGFESFKPLNFDFNLWLALKWYVTSLKR